MLNYPELLAVKLSLVMSSLLSGRSHIHVRVTHLSMTDKSLMLFPILILRAQDLEH